jgi:hypothetical protein
MDTKFWLGHPNVIDYLEDLDIPGRIILKLMSEKDSERCRQMHMAHDIIQWWSSMDLHVP